LTISFESIPHFSQLYALLAAAVFMLVVVKLWQRPRSPWQVLTALVACTLLLPFENGDYVLVQWFLPFALFMGADGVYKSTSAMCGVSR